jgi:glyoxylase-like metal-dependent hydrolase (beta-lactamase superfamily II)
MQIYTLDTGFFKLDGGAMFGVVPKSLWNKENPADENNLCTWAMRCMLICENGRNILIDTGMGNKQSEKFFGHYYPHGDDTLLNSINKIGLNPSDITDVILTHLHFDHCGGAVSKKGDELILTFPNATYWSSEKHWQHAIHPNARERASFLKENMLPIEESGRLKFIEEDKQKRTAFSNNIEIQFVHGHTNSMMIPFIHYNGKTIAYMADLIPSTAHIPLPYIMGYDMYPMTTLMEKESFLEEAVKNETILFFEHDPIIECCTVQKTEKGFRKKDVFKLESIN